MLKTAGLSEFHVCVQKGKEVWSMDSIRRPVGES